MSLTDEIETEALMVPGLFWESLLVRPAWHADALCREYPEVSFFPERGQPSAPAKAICARCLAREQCHQAAVETGEVGVWGGTSQEERKALRRAQEAA